MSPASRDALENAFLPEPNDEKGQQRKTGQPMTPVDRLKKTWIEGQELKTFKQAAGIKDDDERRDDHKGNGESEVSKMMVATMQSYSTALTSMLTELVKMQSGASRGGNNEQGEFMKFLIGEVKDLKTKIDTGGSDPWAMVDEYNNRMGKIQEEIKRGLGITPGAAGMAGAASSMDALRVSIELEKIRQESAERQRQHEENMLLQQRRWVVEDKKWDADFGLRLRQVDADSKNSDKKFSAFQDLAASVIGSIGPDESASSGQLVQAPAPQFSAPQPEQKKIPTSFTCHNITDTESGTECGTLVQVPTGAMSATCPKCGAIYEMRPAA